MILQGPGSLTWVLLSRRWAKFRLRQAYLLCPLRWPAFHAPSRNTAPLLTPGAHPHCALCSLAAVCPWRTSRGQDQRDGRRTTMTRKRTRKMTTMRTSFSLLFVHLGCRPMTLGKLGRRTHQSRYPWTRAATRHNRLPRPSNLGCRPVAGRGFRVRRVPRRVGKERVHRQERDKNSKRARTREK